MRSSPLNFGIASLILVSTTDLASAQVFTRITWQASLDDGASWTSDQLSIGDARSNVRIRALFDWQHPDGYALAGASFDATVTSVDGGALGDTVSAIRRLEPLVITPQTLTTFRFGSVLKIDDERDTRPPAQGDRGVRVGQAAEYLGLPFTRENPVAVFDFVLHFDATPGTRRVAHVFTMNSGGFLNVPFLWRDREGTGVLSIPNSIVRPLDLVVVPAPPAASALLAVLPLAHRRRGTAR
ncbi:MAG: hypothetical protein SFZ23_09695 [Planctomycetota bacterium]|nr:hypothetical protein [Planctomycetota bacterium]